jgi:hypothetical protein
VKGETVTTREWLTIAGIALAGAVATMLLRVMVFAFRIALSIALQALFAVLLWAVVGAVVVMVLRTRSSH